MGTWATATTVGLGVGGLALLFWWLHRRERQAARADRAEAEIVALRRALAACEEARKIEKSGRRTVRDALGGLRSVADVPPSEGGAPGAP